MYIMLTNACNMTCAHCCMRAVKHTGRAARYMSRAHIEAACKLSATYGEHICLGGGEPTLHPDFMFAFGMAILSAESGTLVITNGSNKELTLRMLTLASAGNNIFGCEVSIDSFHDFGLMDGQVREMATRLGMVRNTERNLLAQGRGKDFAHAKVGCACEDIYVDVDGSVYWCGCKRKEDLVGHLDNPGAIQEKLNGHRGYSCNGKRIINED